MKTLTFYKHNLLSGKFEKPIKEIISDFLKTEQSPWDMPFERLILNHMSTRYGSFDPPSDKDLRDLYNEFKNQKNG